MDLINPTRRGLLKGLGLLIAAPAIIKVAGIMPVKAYNPGTILIDDPWPEGCISEDFMRALTYGITKNINIMGINFQQLHDAHDAYCRSLREMFRPALLQDTANQPIAPPVG